MTFSMLIILFMQNQPPLKSRQEPLAGSLHQLIIFLDGVGFCTLNNWVLAASLIITG
jgi:hypothetical protein